LAISRQLVQLMGSDIQVESTPGQGSRFWFDLELQVTQRQEDSPDRLEAVVGYAGDRRTVLIVDDKAYNRAVMAEFLAPLGFAVQEAANGQEGLAQVQQHRPDVVLVDLVMPLMDGFEMTRRLRQMPEFHAVKVIAISASVLEFDQRISQEGYCDDFLPKPIHESALLEKLQAHLGLEWIYAPERQATQENSTPQATTTALSGEPLVSAAVPPELELKALLDLALRGDLKGIVATTHHIEAVHPQWAIFAAQLRQLAASYKGKQVIEFIKRYQSQA